VAFYAGWNPAAREPPKRRHFATNTVAAEICPFRPCAASIVQQQKNAGFQRVSFKTLWASVGGEPTVLNLKLKILKAGQSFHYADNQVDLNGQKMTLQEFAGLFGIFGGNAVQPQTQAPAASPLAPPVAPVAPNTP